MRYTYKLVFVAIFHSIACKFLISYSSTINYLWLNGQYDPEKFKEYGCLAKIYKVIYLSFIGPVIFAMVQVINFVKAVLLAPFALINCSGFYDWVEEKVNIQYEKWFGLSVNLAPGRKVQMSIMQLCFESVPMLIVQALIFFKVIHCPELIQGSNSNSLYISMGTTVISIISTMISIKIESQAFDEQFLMYTLQCMKAR